MRGDRACGGEEFLLFRLVGGAFGIAVQNIVVARRTAWRHLELSDFLGSRRFASLDTLANLTQQLQSLGLSESVARRQIARMMRQQTGILALDDAFLLGASVMFLFGVFVWCARLKKGASADGAQTTANCDKKAVTTGH